MLLLGFAKAGPCNLYHVRCSHNRWLRVSAPLNRGIDFRIDSSTSTPISENKVITEIK